MGRWQPLTNFRRHLEQHPPVVIFFVCLLMLSATFSGLAFYIQTHDVKNPDVVLDWNQFLESVAGLQYCLPQNSTPIMTSSEENGSSRGNGLNSVENSEILSLLVPLVIKDSMQQASSFNFSTTVQGDQLGLRGSIRKEALNLTFFFYPRPQDKHFANTVAKNSLNPDTNSGTQIPAQQICLTLSVPAHILPRSPLPPSCPVIEDVSQDWLTPKAAALQTQKMKDHPKLQCLSMKFTPSADLSVWLSQAEKDLAEHHLLLITSLQWK
ncbi:transmembrane protein 248 isoform X2 [Denticeps clupeoides]|uniref:transmembrane protein 248 isoform X2 n=1 Tax=Denticeps clupeoides TaxID=299321 RepID=UPI0010A2EDEC|nr:transmembrane protein 248-like isoform X2 [Denticeps clupeoides]